jgi:hypothetical protein
VAGEPTLAMELAKAAPYVLGALVGGGLTVLGGIAGQLLTHRLTGEREARNYRREKLFQYVELLDADSHWLEQLQSDKCFGADQDGPADQPPWDRAHTISCLFLEFGKSEIEFIKARSEYQTAIRRVGIKRIQDVQAGTYPNMATAKPNAELMTAMTTAYRAYLGAKGTVLQQARKLGEGLVPRKGL